MGDVAVGVMLDFSSQSTDVAVGAALIRVRGARPSARGGDRTTAADDPDTNPWTESIVRSEKSPAGCDSPWREARRPEARGSRRPVPASPVRQRRVRTPIRDSPGRQQSFSGRHSRAMAGQTPCRYTGARWRPCHPCSRSRRRQFRRPSGQIPGPPRCWRIR